MIPPQNYAGPCISKCKLMLDGKTGHAEQFCPTRDCNQIVKSSFIDIKASTFRKGGSIAPEFPKYILEHIT